MALYVPHVWKVVKVSEKIILRINNVVTGRAMEYTIHNSFKSTRTNGGAQSSVNEVTTPLSHISPPFEP